jgi:glycosyltransferase involved in cell wall biosynthesis
MISVVIPLYNKVRHVKRALDSVLAQTYQDYEVVVVNDGSTDGSEKVVEQYSDPRIRLVNQANAGASVARNRGIAETRADFIAFLDADDEWLPVHLETISRLSRSYPDCGLYATGSMVHRSDGYEMKLRYPSVPRPPWEGVIDRYFVVRNPQPICSSTAAVWRRVFEDVGCFPAGEGYGEDMEMWCRIALKYRVAFSTCYGAIVYCNAENRVSDNTTTPIYTAMIGTLDRALKDKSLPAWVKYEDVLDYRNYLAMVAARTGILRLKGYSAAARRLLRSTWATRRLRGAVAVLYLVSFLPRSTVSSLWKALVVIVRFVRRTFRSPR